MQSRVGALIAVVLAVASPARAGVSVFLERNGLVTEDGVEIPRFGGGDSTWKAVVACVKKQYEPFAVDIVDTWPARGHFITAVVGGRASQLGFDDEMIDGVGPFDGDVEPDAIVHVFSQTSGERDIANLCAATAHEIGHALGLDHELYCGDIMSYYGDQCGEPRFVDAEAPCGEDDERDCASGEATQSSYRRLGQLVGFRDGHKAATSPTADPDHVRRDDPDRDDDGDDDGDEGWVGSEVAASRREPPSGDDHNADTSEIATSRRTRFSSESRPRRSTAALRPRRWSQSPTRCTQRRSSDSRSCS
jgi:hypothetical protein